LVHAVIVHRRMRGASGNHLREHRARHPRRRAVQPDPPGEVNLWATEGEPDLADPQTDQSPGGDFDMETTSRCRPAADDQRSGTSGIPEHRLWGPVIQVSRSCGSGDRVRVRSADSSGQRRRALGRPLPALACLPAR
jgi:hypothetical protein